MIVGVATGDSAPQLAHVQVGRSTSSFLRTQDSSDLHFGSRIFRGSAAAQQSLLSTSTVNNGNGINDGLLQIPCVDLQGIETDGARRKEAVDEIRRAAETWGFFRITSHGVPISVMDGILEATRRFHEQPKEDKMHLYSADGRQSVRFYTINGTFQENHVASWRDALGFNFPDGVVDSQALPLVCS